MAFFSKLKRKLFNNEKSNDVVLDKISESKKESIEKYSTALYKSRESFTKKIQKLLSRNRKIDENYFEELEEVLITSDIGVNYVASLIETIKTDVKIKKITDPKQINELIFEKMFGDYLDGDEEIVKLNLVPERLNVILVVGVNGVGKTTTIGKLSNKFKNEGRKISLAAADTFRAGAVEQLRIWSRKVDIPITLPKKDGQDPASVVYEAIQNAKNDGTEILICDTAGRLQNKVNLMKELEKINSIIERETGEKPIETLLVIDATTGQSGVQQAYGFNELIDLTGIVLTKMDSSSKGGIIISIKSMFNIPVKFIGLGERLIDLEEFDLTKYIYSLTKPMIEYDSSSDKHNSLN